MQYCMMQVSMMQLRTTSKSYANQPTPTRTVRPKQTTGKRSRLSGLRDMRYGVFHTSTPCNGDANGNLLILNGWHLWPAVCNTGQHDRFLLA